MYSHAHLTWGSNSNLISQSWQGLFSFISKSHVHYDLWFINDFPKSSKRDKFSMWWSIINLFWFASNLQQQNIQLGLKHETAIFSILNLNSAPALNSDHMYVHMFVDLHWVSSGAGTRNAGSQHAWGLSPVWSADPIIVLAIQP